MTTTATITDHTWVVIGTPARERRVPIPAPAMVPREKQPWKWGMIARPRRCSTSVPSKLIATPIAPTPARARRSIAPVRSGLPASTNATAEARLTAMASTDVNTARRAPKRPTNRPASGREMIDPSDPTSRSNPIWPGLRPSSDWTVGIRDAQLENTNPAAKNTANTAIIAPLTPAPGGEALVVITPLGWKEIHG